MDSFSPTNWDPRWTWRSRWGSQWAWQDVVQNNGIQLPLGPVSSVESVVYFDADGVQNELDADLYVLDNFSESNLLYPAIDTSWPATYAAVNAVRIRYVVGFDELPKVIYAAILLILGSLYRDRENSSPQKLESVPAGAEALLDLYPGKLRLGMA